MKTLNENIFHQYNKWKTGYVRKENSLQLRLQKFLDDYKVNKNSVFYCKMPKCTISKDGRKVNVNGLVNILIHDEYLINGKLPFPFGDVKEIFNVNSCDDLISLEGAPEKVGKSFFCECCHNLTSLKGAPKKVGRNFDCSYCDKLTSLEGAPEKVGGDFVCSGCKSLTSLEGAPEEVGGNFLCASCKSLKSFDGLPKKIEGYLIVDDKFKNKVPSYVKAEKGVLGTSEYNPIPF